MSPPGRTLGLFQNGRRVGTLLRTPSGLRLDYAQEWLSWRGANPVSLALPLDPAGRRGERVLCFLDNLLPDSESVRLRLAARLDAPDTHPFTLLARLGRCTAGALTFMPAGESPGRSGPAVGTAISDGDMAKLISRLDRRPLGAGARFRISLAGAQRKTALLFQDGGWRLPVGLTPTTHILKPQIGSVMGVDFSQSVENEFLCLALASAFGLPVARAWIADFHATRVLVVERFDRQWEENGRLLRIPHEDCAQALGVPSRRKYEKDGGPGLAALMGLLAGSARPDADRRAFLRAQIVFWLLAAVDGHAKNYSLRLLPRGPFRLAPLYDIVSLQPGLARGELPRAEAMMSLAVGNARVRAPHEITPQHFVESATAAGVPARVVRRTFEELIENRTKACAEAAERLPRNFPEKIASRIFDGVAARLRRAGRDHV